MPYCNLSYQDIPDRNAKKIFLHADAFLFDVFRMFEKLPSKGGGAGNFSIVLILLCVLDGLATEVWPHHKHERGQQKRFKKLVRSRLAWGSQGKSKWLDKGTAADQLYTEFRNPLTHELAKDKAAASRPNGFTEPVIAKWGFIPNEMQDISRIDALPTWDDGWPILSESQDRRGGYHGIN